MLVLFHHTATGATLYTQLWRINPVTKAVEVFGRSTGLWVTPVGGNVANYDVAGSETPAASYNYAFDIDEEAYLGTAGAPFEARIFIRAGGSPAWSDTQAGALMLAYDPISDLLLPPSMIVGQGPLVRSNIRAVNNLPIDDPDELGAQLTSRRTTADFTEISSTGWLWDGVPLQLHLNTASSSTLGVRDSATLDQGQRFRVDFDIAFTTLPIAGEILYLGLFRSLASPANINNLSGKLADDADGVGDSAKDLCVAGIQLTGNGSAITAKAVAAKRVVGVTQYGAFTTSINWASTMLLSFVWNPRLQLLQLIDRTTGDSLYEWPYADVDSDYTSRAIVESLSGALAFGAAGKCGGSGSTYNVLISNVFGHGPGYCEPNSIPTGSDVPKLVAEKLFSNNVTVDGKSFAWLVSRIAAALLGKTSGNTGATVSDQTEIIRKVNDASVAFTATTDASRNRVAIVDSGAAPSVTVT